MFTFDANQAQTEVTGGKGLNCGGAFICTFDRAEFKKSPNSMAQSLDFDVETTDGNLVKYLSIWFAKKDGQSNPIGATQIQHLMGLLKLQKLQKADQLIGKTVGIAMQKVYYVKNDGSLGSKMDFKAFYNPQTMQTYPEMASSKKAEFIESKLAEWQVNIYPEGHKPSDIAFHNNGDVTIHTEGSSTEEELPDWLK